MRPTSVVALAALGVAALAGGWYFGTAATAPEQEAVPAGDLMFPGLAARLGDAAKVEVTHGGSRTVIEKRPDGGWGIASMRDYPVQGPKLRGMLTGLTELRLTEPRTSDPAEYGRLGVDDPDAKGSAADLLRVLGADGKPILALIVGHRRVRSQVNVPEQVYVRRPGDSQSWLAEGNLQVDADASLWLDRDVLNIGHERIAGVSVERTGPGGELAFGQAGGKFALTRPAEHPELEAYKVDDVARALELLTFQAVRADADAPGSAAGQAVFATGDGLVVKVTVLHADRDVWARFAVSGDGGASAEARRLNGRLAGWTYQVGAWKEKSLVPSIDDLKREQPAAAADPAEAADPAGPGVTAPATAPGADRR